MPGLQFNSKSLQQLPPLTEIAASPRQDDYSSWQVFSCKSHCYSVFSQAFLYSCCQKATQSLKVTEGNIFTEKMYSVYFLTYHTKH